MRMPSRIVYVTSAATAVITQLFHLRPIYASRTVTSSPLAFTVGSIRSSSNSDINTKYLRLSHGAIKREEKLREKRMSYISSSLFHSPKNSSHAFPTMAHYYYSTVGSTQDEARKILRGESAVQPENIHLERMFAVSSAEQTEGRGTSGRLWIAPRGNTFLTVAFPIDKLHIIPTLLPLQMGCIVAKQIQNIIYQFGNNSLKKAEVKLKWPNDVLIDNKKVAGILIESEQDARGRYWFMVGIGVNWGIAPNIDQTGPHRGRNATCIYQYLYCDELDEVKKDVDANKDARSGRNVGLDGAKQLGYDIAVDIENWLEVHHSKERERYIEGEDIVREWESWAEFGKEQIMRDAPGHDIVIPLSLEPDGRLRVKESNGRERILCADYLL